MADLHGRAAAQGGVDAAEVGKFDELARTWWDPAGPMAPLHRQGPARLAFLRRQLAPLAGTPGLPAAVR